MIDFDDDEARTVKRDEQEDAVRDEDEDDYGISEDDLLDQRLRKPN